MTEYKSSPSTVEFKYSSQPGSSSLFTIPSLIDFLTSTLQAIISLLLAQWCTIHLSSNRIIGPILLYIDVLLSHQDLRILQFLPQDGLRLTQFGIICIFLLSTLLFFSKPAPIEESCLIIRSLGVQTTTRMRFPLSSHSRFIPASEIDDVVLYEGFKGLEVRYYLGVVVNGEERLEVVFPKLLPKREILEQVWRGAREVFFQVDEETMTNGEWAKMYGK